MDKNAIKKYAVWARRELIARVSQRATLYEITEEGYGEVDAVSVHGRILSLAEKNQRRALIAQIQQKGFEQVMEEIAYTWFNRFSALRFMEVNGYLPTRIRVFTDEENNFKPQIMTEAINLEMDGLDIQKVFAFKDANDDDGLFKYLIITQCNALSSILPGMFQKIADYTELLFPDNLLREGSIVEQMVSMIPEEDWTDQVQIIGWLYEGYNTDRNELVYNGNMAKSRITKDLLPAATTIFTPDWPIRYMVENSLGRLWLEGHPNDNLKSKWKYYLDEEEQSTKVKYQLAEIRKEYATLKPEDIRVIDPCQGSGHILVYMFDVLLQIYEAYGYSIHEAVTNIIEHNIWGIDIDERAAQLAYFSVMMKARQYDRNFFRRNIQPHVFAILESNNLDLNCINYFVDGRPELQVAMDTLVKALYDAKEYGSILKVPSVNFNVLYSRFIEIKNEDTPNVYAYQAIDSLLPFVKVAQALSQKYHSVVTNPPYLGATRFSPKLSDFVKKYYPNEKADLSMVMYKRAFAGFSIKYGMVAFITTSSWLFLSSFLKLRQLTSVTVTMTSIVDFGTELFEGKVGHNPITAWVIRNGLVHDYLQTGIRLIDYCYSRRDEKESQFFSENNRYYSKQDDYEKIPGKPIAYWINHKIINAFEQGLKLEAVGSPKQGMIPGNVDEFLRLWYEVNYKKIGFNHTKHEDITTFGFKWFPYNKGGAFRRWTGNIEHIINMENDGYDIKYSGKNNNYRLREPKLYFKEAITWSKVTAGSFSARYMPTGCLFDIAGCCVFFLGKRLKYVLGFMNSKVCDTILELISPTLNYEVEHIKSLPILFKDSKESEIEKLVEFNMELTAKDWDSFETSWVFNTHPLVPIALAKNEHPVVVLRDNNQSKFSSLLSKYFARWEQDSEQRFKQLKENEEKLNRIFIDIYGLQDELTTLVEDKDVTIRKADFQREIRSLISYAVGCMFGRYSLDIPGLIYAGGTWDASKYKTFEADSDAIIPICDDEYFNDDIVGRFVKFVEVVYGKETLEENLKFIADALGGTGTSREIIRNYFINGFYADHLKVYQKRPIYWLFDSGKKNGFKCLVYMHRYQPDTIARIRTDYVHEQQSRYRTAMADLQNRIDNATTTSERVKLTKKLKTVREQDEELRVYEEKIHHLADQMIKIDLDDGVKVNYAKFQDVLAKIK